MLRYLKEKTSIFECRSCCVCLMCHHCQKTIGWRRQREILWLTWGTTWDQRHLWSSRLLSWFSLSVKRDVHIYSQNSAQYAVTHTHVGVVFYLHIYEIVERVNVLLHQPFHLENTKMTVLTWWIQILHREKRSLIDNGLNLRCFQMLNVLISCSSLSLLLWLI